MGTIYEWTFFLALGLLAIVVTIFVFAVSLLGRALETASREQEKTTKEQKETTEKEIAAIQKQISDLGKKGRIDKEKLKELEKKLKQLRKQEEKFEKKLGRIGKTPELLTVKGGVVPCGGCLLAALVLTSTAWYLSTIENLIWALDVPIWILGLAAIGYTISRIYQCLRVIESVAITSEEAALARETKALKGALVEFEEGKKPKLRLALADKKFPLRVRADSESSFKLNLDLVKGELAEYVDVHVCLPPGFGFPNEETSTLPSNHDYPNYIVMIWHEDRIIPPLYYWRNITFKSPSTKGSYSIIFYKFCRGFAASPEEGEVIVE
ncbi:MAG: hypothetical protein MUO17_04390 [Dehalococcoidales bacterium]|nr:hypothetical protein [Dehalococcoidales bacterium]